MMQKHQQHVTKPGIWATISAGFELTTKHYWLILIPILLDTFFWLGPRLSLRLIVEQGAAVWQEVELIPGMAEQMLALAPNLNLFTVLAVPWLGVPALMSSLVTPFQTPITPAAIELQSVGAVGLLLAGLSLLGLLLSVFFLLLVAQAVGMGQGWAERPFLFRLRIAWVRLFMMGIALVALIALIYVPVGMVSLVASFISPLLGLFTLLVVPVVVIWIVIALYFIPQGVLLHGQTLRQAMGVSLGLLQQQAASSLSMILAVMVLGTLAQQVLILFDDGSWVTSINIVAHAFIQTSLTAATFIYYRDRVNIETIQV